MATPEGKVKELVKSALRKYGVYWHCPVQNGMGAPSLDFVCCYRGKYFAIETKAPGKKPTPRQELTMEQISASGGVCFVVDGEAALAHLNEWLGGLD
ncbi:MAG: VRR-NUC domain-containing protein [Patescibacteria group bacterium]|nr:VRR-NUC domain-containing protein [Patescibacteria group bacterium]